MNRPTFISISHGAREIRTALSSDAELLLRASIVPERCQLPTRIELGDHETVSRFNFCRQCKTPLFTDRTYCGAVCVKVARYEKERRRTGAKRFGGLILSVRTIFALLGLR